MDRVIVVTDSSATVPPELVKSLDIRVVPMQIGLGGRSLRDGVDVTPGELYRWLRMGGEIPTTSAPSVGDFVRVYAVAQREARGIVSIHLPAGLSATWNTAVLAGQLVGGVPIRVLDCGTAAMGQGFVVLEAARAAAAGADMEAVIERAREVAGRIHLLATLETLEYLHRGGRIGKAATLLASVVQIKPVLSLRDGQVEVVARPRTRSRASGTLLKEVERRAAGRPLHVAVQHADVPEEADLLAQEIRRRFPCRELYLSEFTPVMGAHVGPGLLGVVFYAD